MNHRLLRSILFCLNLSLLFSSSQVPRSTLIHIPPESPSHEGEPVYIRCMVEGEIPVNQARLFHRTVGQASYLEVIMNFEAGYWLGVIPSIHVKSEGIEYLLVIDLADGSVLGYPDEDPFKSPFLLSVLPEKREGRAFIEGRKDQGKSLQEADILIISPEEDQVVYSDELLVVVSLFNVKRVDVSSIKLFIDDLDVTPQSTVSTDIVTYSPESIQSGYHVAKIQLRDVYGVYLNPVSWSFFVVERKVKIVSPIEEFSYSGNARTDFSFDKVGGEVLGIAQTTAYLKGGWPWLSFRGDLRLTTEESLLKQPKNRYSLDLRSEQKFIIQLGDFTPVLSPYTINGKRVRGYGIDVNLNWIRFQLVNGELERDVQGDPENVDDIYQVTNIKLDTTSQGDLIPIYYLDRLGYTFRRFVQAYRFSLNYRNRYRLGLNFQKTKDEPWSINRDVDNAKFYIPNWENYISIVGIDSGIYTFSKFKEAITGVASYELPSKEWGGNNPQDNIVFGFDMGMSFDNQRLIFDVAWAMSLLNKNIWPGTLTKTQLDTILDDSTDGFLAGIYDLDDIIEPADIKDLLVVNQFLVPLIPIDPYLYEESRFAAIINMPSSAFHFKMRTYYYNNFLQIRYSQIGPEFYSLPNPYFPQNIREFNITDRIRLLHNKLSISLSYQHRNNRIIQSVKDPYSQNTFNTSFSLFPGVGLPSFTFNFQSIGRTNNKTELDTIEYTDNVVYEDFREDSRTRNSLFSINIPIHGQKTKQNLSLSFNFMAVTDLLEDMRLDGSSNNVESRSYGLAFSSRYSIPLQTSFNLFRYTIELPPIVTGEEVIENKTQITNLMYNAIYNLWANRLTLRGGVSYLTVKGTSKYVNYGLNGGVDYKIKESLSSRCSILVKVKESGNKFELGTFALKFSANYVF